MTQAASGWPASGHPQPKASRPKAVACSMQLPKLLALPPHHLVHDARVGLDDLHDLGGHALVGVVGHELLESEPSASSATAVRAAQEAITVPKAANMLMKIER